MAEGAGIWTKPCCWGVSDHFDGCHCLSFLPEGLKNGKRANHPVFFAILMEVYSLPQLEMME
jgi:cytochrome c oxidase assembly protein Cox11